MREVNSDALERNVPVASAYSEIGANPQGLLDVVLSPIAGHYKPSTNEANAIDATFLLDMAARSETSDTVYLPISRQDIGDSLGLTIETVSRTLTQLERQRVIALPGTRRVVLRNRRQLLKLEG